MGPVLAGTAPRYNFSSRGGFDSSEGFCYNMQQFGNRRNPKKQKRRQIEMEKIIAILALLASSAAWAAARSCTSTAHGGSCKIEGVASCFLESLFMRVS